MDCRRALPMQAKKTFFFFIFLHIYNTERTKPLLLLLGYFTAPRERNNTRGIHHHKSRVAVHVHWLFAVRLKANLAPTGQGVVVGGRVYTAIRKMVLGTRLAHLKSKPIWLLTLPGRGVSTNTSKSRQQQQQHLLILF